MATYRQGTGITKQIGGVVPTERADGTPLAADEIGTYVRFSTYDGGAVTEEDVDLVAGVFDGILAVDDMAPGIYVYWYQTQDTGGRRSVDSEKVTLEILLPLAAPNPPTGIAVS